jgi:hypothetical protein
MDIAFQRNFSLKSLVKLVYRPLSFLPAPSFIPVPSSLPAALPSACIQRWASTLANRSNAPHDLITEPPPPDVGICVARGSDSLLAGVRMSNICPCTPCPPPPPGIGQRSKVVILPTSAAYPLYASNPAALPAAFLPACPFSGCLLPCCLSTAYSLPPPSLVTFTFHFLPACCLFPAYPIF